MSILVTGGAGFIGSNFLNTLIDSCDDEIICLDSLTYASDLNNVPKEVTLLPYDISDKDKVFGCSASALIFNVPVPSIK